MSRSRRRDSAPSTRTCSRGHQMTRSNITWSTRELLRSEEPKTDAERRTGKRWTPVCRTCWYGFIVDTLTLDG